MQQALEYSYFELVSGALAKEMEDVLIDRLRPPLNLERLASEDRQALKLARDKCRRIARDLGCR